MLCLAESNLIYSHPCPSNFRAPCHKLSKQGIFWQILYHSGLFGSTAHQLRCLLQRYRSRMTNVQRRYQHLDLTLTSMSVSFPQNLVAQSSWSILRHPFSNHLLWESKLNHFAEQPVSDFRFPTLFLSLLANSGNQDIVRYYQSWLHKR